MKIFVSSGKLIYSENPDKLILEVDQGLSDFYFSMVPKCVGLKKQYYPAHISVVRNVIVPNKAFWKKYEGNIINFTYEDYIYNDELYYWLHVFSSELEDIRKELGLKPSGDVTLSPDGRHKFHITIGNLKK